MTRDTTFIDEQVLNEWVVTQRWFASKTREVSSVEIVDSVWLSDELVLCLIEARFPVGTHETYQVPLAVRKGGEGAPIFEAEGSAVYVALADPETGRELLKAMQPASTVWGHQLRLWSTHNGEGNYFNRLLQSARAGEIAASVHRVTIVDAVEQGLVEKVLKLKRPDAKARQEWLDKVRATVPDEDAWNDRRAPCLLY